jgi:hypothetical protein
MHRACKRHGGSLRCMRLISKAANCFSDNNNTRQDTQPTVQAATCYTRFHNSQHVLRSESAATCNSNTTERTCCQTVKTVSDCWERNAWQVRQDRSHGHTDRQGATEKKGILSPCNRAAAAEHSTGGVHAKARQNKGRCLHNENTLCCSCARCQQHNTERMRPAWPVGLPTPQCTFAGKPHASARP